MRFQQLPSSVVSWTIADNFSTDSYWHFTSGGRLVYSDRFEAFPTWSLVSIYCCRGLCVVSKRVTAYRIARSKFKEHMVSHGNVVSVYTDGSKV